MTYECNCLYETKCMDHYQKCKFALMICKTRCPADTNTNDVKKTCKKKTKNNPNKTMVTGSIINFSVYHTYQNIQTKSCSCTKIEFFLMPGL